MNSIDPVMQIFNTGQIPDLLSDSTRVRVVKLWLDNNAAHVSRSPMLKDLKNRVDALIVVNSRPEELIKNRKLIQTHLELKTLDLEKVLPLLIDHLPTKDLTALLSSPLITLSEEAIKKLSKLQILRLSALRMEIPYAQNFKQILQQPKNLAQGIKNIRGLGLTQIETDAALAHYIEHHSIKLNDIRFCMTDEDFLRLAPHLRYVNLMDSWDRFRKLLQNCSNLNVLLIDESVTLKQGIEDIALPLCTELECRDCTSLKALPALPLCENLRCGGCTNLASLPALPRCKVLICYDCKLQALPELPRCEILRCWKCTSLQALPELPLCKELDCKKCTGLQALPALPLCEKFTCDKTNLASLPALPLCKELRCQDCKNLTSLPVLSLCKQLICFDCTNLASLPELPLCEILQCWRCTTLVSLPALPHCCELNCIGCTNLTLVPLSLGQNPDLLLFDISSTRIDPALHQAILSQCRQMRSAEAVKILPLRLEKWKVFAKRGEDFDISALSNEQKMILNEWLHRLERTKDFTRTQFLLANIVCNIVADLPKNKEFQELFFPQAEANNACCEDRAAMSLNEIYTSWKIICTPENLKIMTGVAKTLRLRKELQKLIKGDERESVEIFLYYESTLSKRLQLETAIQNMSYGTIGKRSWIDQERLVQNVEEHYFEDLFDLPVFQKTLLEDKAMKKRWDEIDLEFSDKLGERPKGSPESAEVLDYQHRQGEIMQEWRRKKMDLAKEWYLNI